MKKYFYALLVLALFFAACNSSSDQSGQDAAETDTLTETVTETDSTDFGPSIQNIPPLWQVEFQNNNKTEKLMKPANDSVALMTPQALVDALNFSYPDIHLDLTGISHDTIYISIPQSQKLTDELGSTGAYNYLATAVYNLTELNKVRFVNFRFSGGEHAAPGTYDRDDFKRLR